MIAKHVLLLGIVLGLVGGAPILADEPGDLAKLRDTLLARKKESWELSKRQDVAAMRDFYPEDVVLILEDGTRLNKAGYLELVPDLKLDSYAIEENADIVLLTPEAATLIFRVTFTSAIKDEKPRTVTVLSSSTYVRRSGKWLNVFYQETPVK